MSRRGTIYCVIVFRCLAFWINQIFMFGGGLRRALAEAGLPAPRPGDSFAKKKPGVAREITAG
jgi:hypothetical protein